MELTKMELQSAAQNVRDKLAALNTAIILAERYGLEVDLDTNFHSNKSSGEERKISIKISKIETF